jgi:hypothetical protein
LQARIAGGGDIRTVLKIRGKYGGVSRQNRTNRGPPREAVSGFTQLRHERGSIAGLPGRYEKHGAVRLTAIVSTEKPASSYRRIVFPSADNFVIKAGGAAKTFEAADKM